MKICIKRSFVLPLLVAVVAGLVAFPSQAQFEFDYTINNGTVTIVAYGGTNRVVVIPDTIDGLPVTSIGTEAFWSDSITGVTIPSSVTNIGYGALAFNSLTNVTIPNSVTSIGDSAFSDCSRLTAVEVDPLNSSYSAVDGVLFDKGQTTLIQYPIGKTDNYYSVPTGVTTIYNDAFLYCFNLASVTIPNSVTNIGDSAFEGCGLTNATIPNGVTGIGNSAFNGCGSLTSIVIPNSVTSIGLEAFQYCTRLTNVTIPNSVTSIGNGAFDYCTSLTAISVETNNPAYSSISGVLFNQNQTTLIQYPGGKVGSYSIPNSVTSIGDHAFRACVLTDITIGNSVTNIGDSCFFRCDALTSVTIGKSVTNIGAGAFEVCWGLTKVLFGGNAPAVGPDLFDVAVFEGGIVFDPATIYFLPGTTGWSTNFSGLPTAIWSPEVQTADDTFGVKSNQFGFNITWADGLSVVVEASPSLSKPVWLPVATNTLSGGTFYFSDPEWSNYPSRFYRVRSR
jgi:hypothetical protein